MAIISKILSLPSATQYEGEATPIDSSILYSNSSWGSGSAGNTFFTTSSSPNFWKNKASTTLNYVIEWYNSVSESWVEYQSGPSPAFSSISSSTSRVGIRHRIRSYARVNGTTVYSPFIREYYPQTKPNQSPSIISYSSSPFSMSCSWNTISDANWGGAPSSSINNDRQYEFIIEKDPGTSNAQFIVQVNLGEATSYTFGGSFSGNYRMLVYAVNKAGDSTFLFPNPPTIPIGSATPIFNISAPPPPPFFPPYFGGPLIY
jgi:hypothetical protein